ncbi:MAG TPA: malto-oligosyltrehalose synthase, partial [Polyangiaceae bacterium]|nr:malto-oligosyltrehalose synthase [Polyangiaceae bacterium]
FDVEFDGPTERSKDKVLLPILGSHYGRALEAGQIQVQLSPQGLSVSANGRRLPCSPSSVAGLLQAAASRAHVVSELEILASSFKTVADETHPERRQRHLAVLKRQLATLIAEQPSVESELASVLQEVNSDPDRLDQFLIQQYYRLAYHRIARYDLDYRRFFDIDDLAALSTHRPEVFQATHELILKWVKDGELSALRVDHPDGLLDPIEYFKRLKAASHSLWVVAEKILQPGEQLPDSFQVSGTTGYDFLNALGGVFVDQSQEAAFSELYRDFLKLPEAPQFANIALDAKRFALEDLLGSEVSRLTRLFQRVASSKRRHRDFAGEELRRALCEVIACLPIYRTYVRPNSTPTEADLNYIRRAVQQAAKQRPELDSELMQLLEGMLSGQCASTLEWEFVGRFQQISATAMAKGLEDTAFYRYFRLACLNEVGGDPARFGASPREFHAFCAELQRRWPGTLVTTTTHDTKRSEDARLRLSALTEFTSEWRTAVNEWSELARSAPGVEAPERGMEYLLWQTLVAAHPISEARLTAYLEKAMREAKRETSWANPNADYEGRILQFARGVLRNADVMTSLDAFVRRISPVALRACLSQTLLKLTACGVPDIYQGSELLDTRLTDPDNRAPVDFPLRRQLLEAASRASVEEALAHPEPGFAKLWMIQRVLGLRRMMPDWFGPSATYQPLELHGAQAERVLAFARGQNVVVVAPRLWRSVLDHGFGDTHLPLPPGNYRNLFESELRFEGRVELAGLLRRFPVALLIAERPRG